MAVRSRALSLPRTGLYRIVPQRFLFQNGYAIDAQRDPSRFADPVGTDTIAKLPLFHSESGIGASVGLFDESKPLGSSGTLLRFGFEYHF